MQTITFLFIALLCLTFSNSLFLKKDKETITSRGVHSKGRGKKKTGHKNSHHVHHGPRKSGKSPTATGLD